MTAMRIIVLASALASGRAATAHVVKTYEDSGCAGQVIGNSLYFEACEYRKDDGWRKTACDATHMTEQFYEDAACTTAKGAPTKHAISSSNCDEVPGENRYKKIECAAMQMDLGQVTHYESANCTTPKDEPFVAVLSSFCLEAGDGPSPGVRPASMKQVWTPGVGLVISMHYDSWNCSSPHGPAFNMTQTCSSECVDGTHLSCSWPSGAGSASSARRPAPWAAAAFGAAALAIGAAQYVTA